jgi:hypothetical protein
VEASLDALGTDYIDLYQVHWPDPCTPIRETGPALNDPVGEGLIRHVGVSNYSAAPIEEFAMVLPVETVQPPYHLCPFARERDRGGAPDATSRAGDYRYPAVELSRHDAPLLVTTKIRFRGMPGRPPSSHAALAPSQPPVLPPSAR